MEYLLKTIAAFASIFALYKILIDVILARSSKRREEYNFTKQFITDLNDSEIHQYVLEKGFLALTGKIYPIVEVKQLLRYRCPSQAIEKRSNSDHFIEFDEIICKYVWKGMYKKDYIKRFGPFGYLSSYVIFCFFGLLPFIIRGGSLFSSITESMLSVSLIVIAITCLTRHEYMKEAIIFMKMPLQDD